MSAELAEGPDDFDDVVPTVEDFRRVGRLWVMASAAVGAVCAHESFNRLLDGQDPAAMGQVAVGAVAGAIAGYRALLLSAKE